MTKLADCVVLATNNAHKVEEIKSILGNYFKELKTLKDLSKEVEVVEDGNTFFANAYKKAKEICEAVGLPALADDSGLVVDALGGKPGVYSARFAGEHATTKENNDLLLRLLDGEKHRSARFVSSIVLYYPDGGYVSAEGEAEGEILSAPVGENGFGYDPLFYSLDLKKPFGLATAEEKNSVSHRGKALRNLEKRINES